MDCQEFDLFFGPGAKRNIESPYWVRGSPAVNASMAIHDRRYKRILTNALFAYDVARLLAGRFGLGTVVRQSLRPGPTSSVKETDHERITDSAWAFDTERQHTVMMIVEVQSWRERPLELRILRYVVDRLMELYEDLVRADQRPGLSPVVVAVLYTGRDRWRPPPLHDLFSPLARKLMRFEFPLLYYDVLHMEPEEDPEQPLLRMVFEVERCEDPSETIPVMQAIRGLEDREAYALLIRFLCDKMRQWDQLRDAQGRLLLDAGQLDDTRPLSEVVKEMETVQERFLRQLADRRAEGHAEGRVEGRVEGWAEGQVGGLLLGFRRTLAASGLDSKLVQDVQTHVDQLIEAARRGVHFDPDDIPDGGRLLAAIQESDGPEKVPAERIWGLLPHIPEDDTDPK